MHPAAAPKAAAIHHDSILYFDADMPRAYRTSGFFPAMRSRSPQGLAYIRTADAAAVAHANSAVPPCGKKLSAEGNACGGRKRLPAAI